MKLLAILAITAFLSCQSTTEPKKIDLEFNAEKWATKVGSEFPYREQMLNSVVYNDSIRGLKRSELIDALGDPECENDMHLYYTISQTLMGAWPLHKKSMVIKYTPDDKVEWIKIHK